MGKRNCAVEGCNALEFRSNGICNRHMRDEMAIREIDLEELRATAQEETDESKHALGQKANAEAKGEEFECPRGCGKMSYQDEQVGVSDLGLAFFIGIPVLAGIYFIWSFIAYDWSNTAIATNGSPPHPSVGILALFGIAWFGFAASSFGLINSKTHVCNSCYGRMFEEKAMAYIFDKESLSKLNSLIDSMAPHTSDLKCPICDEKMGRFSVPYTPSDDSGGHGRTSGRVPKSAEGLVAGLAIAVVVTAVKAMVPDAEETIDLDACRECRVVWFDASERGELEDGTIN
tara:strand:- start:41 stop:904 length:864 start_codon:yes stop_codon:yes gene_type:complete